MLVLVWVSNLVLGLELRCLSSASQLGKGARGGQQVGVNICLESRHRLVKSGSLTLVLIFMELGSVLLFGLS